MHCKKRQRKFFRLEVIRPDRNSDSQKRWRASEMPNIWLNVKGHLSLSFFVLAHFLLLNKHTAVWMVPPSKRQEIGKLLIWALKSPCAEQENEPPALPYLSSSSSRSQLQWPLLQGQQISNNSHDGWWTEEVALRRTRKVRGPALQASALTPLKGLQKGSCFAVREEALSPHPHSNPISGW